MSITLNHALRTLALAAAVTTLAACGSSGAGTAKPLAKTFGSANHPEWSNYTFTIGDNGGDGSEGLAALTGVFDNAPYKVKFARFTFGPPLVQAAASGDLDLGSVGDVPPITGAAKEYGFSIVGVSRYLDPTQAVENILVPKGSSIHSAQDLRGKKIAVPQGSSAHGLVLNALASAGLTPADVQLDFLDPAAGATAFASGKVDAWAIWNPQSALAIKQGARALVKGLPPLDQTSNYYVAPNRDLADPSRRAALTDVFQRLAAEFSWGAKHPDQLAQVIAREDGIPLADAKAVLAEYEFHVTPAQQSDIDAEQQLGDAFLEAGQIDKSVNVAQITQNILPAGYDSANTVGS
ncbi:ABC transporter substrate-binding protein [Nocardia sp. NEAU-G5]|uniref:ABC transporter substrate-binding protein n=1 Tax=Nocardia albiluteola TaxID=2842303 RepID=A0ABS6BCI0_9NOCA|nr:ABC transporter substrate-binding protein [Nocardia albiluteola]MBU3067120.1 ABC transporter substrate-binding protein [Nocardia albiluteola]